MRLWPQSLTGQLVALTVLALVVTQIVLVTVLFTNERRRIDDHFHRRIIDRISDTAELLNTLDPQHRESLLRMLQNRRQTVALGVTPPPPEGSQPMTRLSRHLTRRLHSRGIDATVEAYRVPPPPRAERRGRRRPPPPDVWINMRVADGEAFHTRLRTARPRPVWHSPVLITTFATAGIIAVLLFIFARRITTPLRELAEGADRLGTIPGEIRLEERGPEDVRAALRAFNRMDARLSRMLDHQRRMIAAVGHDLRTPLTALRVRAEFVSDTENRDHMIRILDEMQTMTEGILSLVREDARQEARVSTNLTALTEAVCADFQDMGADVTCDAGERLIASVRVNALSRILRNLIENAVRYGERARVRLTRTEDRLVLTIDDDGPGIAQAALDAVFEPFRRLEASRNTETGGLGLGLTIARNLAEAEGAALTLSNRAEGGLRASLALPVQHIPKKEGLS